MTTDKGLPAALLPHRPAPMGRLTSFGAFIAAWGPGLLVMLADTDVGNIVSAAQSGSQWGYRLAPLPLLLIPLLYAVQELAVRIGLFTGGGFGEVIRSHCARPWAWAAGGALAVATIGSLITELVGIAGVGEMYGVSRWLTLPAAAVALMVVVLSGEYRRTERAAVVIGLFELSFFAVAWAGHPRWADIARDVASQPLHEPRYLVLAAALIGATFNPWMVFYQPSALAEKRLGPEHQRAARWDTLAGATLTQLLTVAVLIAASATLGAGGSHAVSLNNVGQISGALVPLLGPHIGRLVFGIGVVGAAMVAAIVCSLAFAWGLGELIGLRRSLEHAGTSRPWFGALFGTCVLGSAVLVLLEPDLVALSILTQVLNAVLMPLVVGVLVFSTTRVLPTGMRLRGRYFWLVVVMVSAASAAGIIGAIAGLGLA